MMESADQVFPPPPAPTTTRVESCPARAAAAMGPATAEATARSDAKRAWPASWLRNIGTRNHKLSTRHTMPFRVYLNPKH